MCSVLHATYGFAEHLSWQLDTILQEGQCSRRDKQLKSGRCRVLLEYTIEHGLNDLQSSVDCFAVQHLEKQICSAGNTVQ
jgi:hypothetical protein